MMMMMFFAHINTDLSQGFLEIVLKYYNSTKNCALQNNWVFLPSSFEAIFSNAFNTSVIFMLFTIANAYDVIAKS